MGAQIAAHFANAHVPVVLLDVSRQAARDGLVRTSKLKPNPFFVSDGLELIRTGSFDEDLGLSAGADWIIEAVVERADIKRGLLERVDRVRRPGSFVSSNTSGLSITDLAQGRSEDFRLHWLGTHFFNPPRYLPLLEIIPTADTDAAVVAAVAGFAERQLGKNTVKAKDTPGFIANHLALFGIARMFEALASGRYTVEEIDAITGPPMGRPKSATFRTVDIAGLDVLLHVAVDLANRLHSEEFTLPPFVHEMVRRGWVGEKAGRGFYERRSTESGKTEIWALDPASMEYRPPQPVKLPSLEALGSAGTSAERVRKLFSSPDRAGEFLRATLPPFLLYSVRMAPEIAYSTEDVDRALRWGYGWDQGPFELCNAIGIDEVLAAADGKRSRTVPPRSAFRESPLPPAGPEVEIFRSARASGRTLQTNAGASLIDLGDGVLAVELHSKMNAIGGDTLSMLQKGVQEAARNFQALVVGTDAVNFSVGANLMLLLIEAQEGNWDEIDVMIRTFQNTTAGLRYSPVPVIVAAAGLTLGGGCEIMLHADRVQAAAETYAGLVEVGVGLIPAAGGTKEMLLRSLSHMPATSPDMLPFVQRAFETIGFAKVSTSAADAVRLGYLRETDGVTMNRDRLLFDAKHRALDRVNEGYTPPQPAVAIPVGGEGVKAALDLFIHLAWRAGRITDHDALIARKLAWVLAGGSLPHAAKVSEDHLLSLEREAFLSLCGERKTLERIQYTLKAGKTLRN